MIEHTSLVEATDANAAKIEAELWLNDQEIDYSPDAEVLMGYNISILPTIGHRGA